MVYNYLPEAIPLYLVTVVGLENVIYLHSKLFGHFQRKVMATILYSACILLSGVYVCVFTIYIFSECS